MDFVIDWEKAPKWEKYAAMDSDGAVWFYENRPQPSNDGWNSAEGYAEYVYNSIWQNTLMERP